MAVLWWRCSVAVFKPSVIGILENGCWGWLQDIVISVFLGVFRGQLWIRYASAMMSLVCYCHGIGRRIQDDSAICSASYASTLSPLLLLGLNCWQQWWGTLGKSPGVGKFSSSSLLVSSAAPRFAARLELNFMQGSLALLVMSPANPRKKRQDTQTEAQLLM